MPHSNIVNRQNQETSLIDDTLAIGQAARNIAREFGERSEIGKGARELAKSADKTSKYLAGFLKRVEQRRAKQQK